MPIHKIHTQILVRNSDFRSNAANGKKCRAPGAVWRLNSILASSAGLLQQAYEYHFVPSTYRSVIIIMQVRAWNINLD